LDAVVSQVLEEARGELQRGKGTSAARLLTDAAYRTRDPQEAQEIIALAEKGLEDAGFFGKGRWKEIIRVASSRLNGTQSGAQSA
jgi:hypothetical protein